MNSPEVGYWIPSCAPMPLPSTVDRVYVGDEIRHDHIPVASGLIALLEHAKWTGKEVTLVTPGLSQEGLQCALRTIRAVTAACGAYEVVCNDWGLLWALAEGGTVIPVVGRLLAGQATDPRLAMMDDPARQQPYERTVLHADGTLVELRYRRPGGALMAHLRDCSIMMPDIVRVLRDRGIHRCEVSNPLQGIDLRPLPDWNVSLHMPEVVVAVMRGERFCGAEKWKHSSFPVELMRQNRSISYRNPLLPPHLDAMGIDRLVYRHEQEKVEC
jgi:hypothetical protein